MTKWPTEKHFTSWLFLAPANKISGGRVLSAATRRSSNRAALSFGSRRSISAGPRRRSEPSIDVWPPHVGKAKAVTATARKLAVLFYRALRYGMAYVDPGVSAYEARYRERVVQQLKRRAKSLGFTLVEKAG